AQGPRALSRERAGRFDHGSPGTSGPGGRCPAWRTRGASAASELVDAARFAVLGVAAGPRLALVARAVVTQLARGACVARVGLVGGRVRARERRARVGTLGVLRELVEHEQVGAHLARAVAGPRDHVRRD